MTLLIRPGAGPRGAAAGLHHTVRRNDDPSASWVILVHGAGLTAEIWDPQVEALARRHHLLLPDLRGHGQSPGLDGGRNDASHEWDGVARDILDLLDHHAIATAHLVGISLGCLVARMAAEIAPGRVRSLVLAGAVARLEPAARLLIRVAHGLKRFVPYLWLYRTYARILMPRRSHRSSRRVVGRQARRLGRPAFLRWLELTGPLPALLRRFRARDPGVPTLYVSGDQDHMFLPGVRDLVSRHPSAALHVVEECGHMCSWQRPAAFNRVVAAFLERA